MGLMDRWKKHKFTLNVKYQCTCGFTMYRKNTAYYTLSPYNKHSIEWNEAYIRAAVYQKERKCPACKKSVIPLLTLEYIKAVHTWMSVMD